MVGFTQSLTPCVSLLEQTLAFELSLLPSHTKTLGWRFNRGAEECNQPQA